MTGFDLKSRLEELAQDIETGPARPAYLIESEARRRRRRRSGWALGAAVVSVAALVTIPAMLGDVDPDRSTETPGPTIAPQPLPHSAGPCAPTAGTDADRELVLVGDDCRTTPLDVGDKITYPALSPDGQALAFVTYERGDAELKIRDLDGGETRTLASSVDTIGDPVWSPDGGTLAFWLNDGGGHPYIYTVPVDGGEAGRVTNGDVNEVAPAWSPDGGEVAFSRQDGIFIVDIATGDERQLTVAPPYLGSPFWGTNNQMALYAIQSGAGEPAEEFRVVEIDPETGDVTGASDWIRGMSTEGVYDDFGIHVAALTPAYPTTIVTTLDYGLSVVSEYAVKGAQIYHLPTRTPEPPRGTTPDGRTYGVDTDRNPPDLIAVAPPDGNPGYVPRRDVNEPPPDSPDQALARHQNMRPHRYPVYAADGVTIVGIFDTGHSRGDPRLVTTTSPPPRAHRRSVSGVLEIDEQGCAYLDDGTTRHWLIWTWQVQIAASSGAVPTLEDFDQERHVATSGDTVDLEVRRLDGQQVQGGPCPSDSPPLYVTADPVD